MSGSEETAVLGTDVPRLAAPLLYPADPSPGHPAPFLGEWPWADMVGRFRGQPTARSN
jgi:hypothetical protein